MVPLTQMQQQFSPVQPDQLFRWNGAADSSGFVESTSPTVNSFPMMSQSGQYGQAVPAPSTALARRQNNRALVPSASRLPFDNVPEVWNGFTEDPAFLPGSNGAPGEHDSVEHLEELAQRAKREAQTKRKQIPPFVQKLSSFLDESRNTELIRWSDKGDSFVVLDEDEFAKTLIPELFKHNNYASFVRQLNMYGFHKRVGLSDNSMKASERKNKSPSEYYNPYFRRGHPNLLWLINKPKSGNNKKKGKKDDGDVESDEDGMVEETYVSQSVPVVPMARGASVVNEVGPLQKKDLVQVRTQLDRLQQQQTAISSMLSKLRQEHTQLYQQAVMFENMHERHENSINAILNFLANVFRKSLEEQGGAQSVQDLLASIIPNAQGHASAQMPRGGVVEINDFIPQSQKVTAMNTPKRQQRLLPPIPHQAGKASTISPSPTPAATTPQPSYQRPQMGSVTEVFDTSPGDSSSPAYIKNELQNNPQEGMMKIIQDTNAVNTNSSGIDLPNVAAKTSTNMSNDQRSKMLSIMAGQMPSRATTSTPSSHIPTPAPPAPTPVAFQNSNVSLSPILSSMAPPSLHDLQATQAELDVLQQLQSDQANQINHLSSLLGPLSPSGQIPGIDDSGNPSFFDNVDYEQFINSNAFSDQHYDTSFAGLNGTGDASDFDFSLDGVGAGGVGLFPAPADQATATSGGVGDHNSAAANAAATFEPGRIFETHSTADTPSPSGTEEIFRNDLGSPERDAKRRRKG
ncbi:hypothetical protein B0T24DRAFT_531542 [Lasiosphaeria ovina]|uniref:HSF-type DNA-binding domain-containing protein n=1 Tax=Lasiosphaeria ovina TaxID=92902 RepID=A0AAE0K8F1_9PEZI|nr:hypothetical protein B0T24DRAFT_531542 [Lasiosphaeria ovina]